MTRSGIFIARTVNHPASEASFSPTELSGLKVWLDASTLVGGEDDPVSTWTDASGNGADGLKGSYDAPTIHNGGLNGLPVLRFTAASNQAMRVTHTVGLPYSVFIVGRLTGAPYGRIFGSIYPSAQNWLAGWWNGFQDTMYGEGFVAPGAVSATTNWKQYSCIGTGSLTSFWSSGTLLASNASGVAGPNLRFAISGYDATGSQELSNAEIAEVLGYNRVLTTDERLALEAYLTLKWGV